MHNFAGLFHGAISQSGCATCFWSITEKAAENAQKYSALLNCTGNSKEILSCLKQKDAKDLVFMQLAFLVRAPVFISYILSSKVIIEFIDIFDIYRSGPCTPSSSSAPSWNPPTPAPSCPNYQRRFTRGVGLPPSPGSLGLTRTKEGSILPSCLSEMEVWTN